MRSSAILHLLISSKIVIGKDTQDIVIDPYASLLCYPCVWEDHEINFLNCFPRSISEIYKTWRLKKDLHILYILSCNDLPAVSVNDRARVPPYAWSLVGEAWIQHKWHSISRDAMAGNCQLTAPTARESSVTSFHASVPFHIDKTWVFLLGLEVY